MSTTSSSDCDCEDYCHYPTGFYENCDTNIWRTQMFPNLGHPLIYYSQINPSSFQPQPRRQRSRKPNCFVKAFKWYTQDHVPLCDGGQSTKPHINEFASWLDTKYDEFMQSNPNDPNSYRLTLKQTSIITAEKNPLNSSCEPCSTKNKFKRLKSQWSKRQRRPCSRDGPQTENTTQSFQYILTPKDLSRPNSCCQSSIHTHSSETQKVQKKVIKSQSCTSFSREKNGADLIDIMTTQEGINKHKCLFVKNTQPSKISSLNNIACQYTIATINKIDVGTQYDKSLDDFKNTSIRNPYQSTSFKSLPPNESKYEKELKVPCSLKDVACQCPSDGKLTSLRSRTSSKTSVKSTYNNLSVTPKIEAEVPVCRECKRPQELYISEYPSVVPVEPKPLVGPNYIPPAPMSIESKDLKVCCSTNHTCEHPISRNTSKTTLKITGKQNLKSTSKDKLTNTSKDNFKSKGNTISKSALSYDVCGVTVRKCAPEPVTCVSPLEVPIETKTSYPPAAVCQETIGKRSPKSDSLTAVPGSEPKSPCHCPQAISIKTDNASTQYERQPFCCDIEKRSSSHVLQTKSQKKCPCEQPIRFDPTVENGAQTSDHCIIFDVHAPYTYPLFMKIVCADKLN